MKCYKFNNCLNIPAEKPVEKFYLSTTISVVIGVVLSLIVLACLVATALQVHCSRIENQQNKDKLRNEVNVYSSNDSVSSSEKYCDGYFADKMFLNHNNTVMTEGEEKEPDVIPQPIGGEFFFYLLPNVNKVFESMLVNVFVYSFK